MNWSRRENVLRGINHYIMSDDIFCRHALYNFVLKKTKKQKPHSFNRVFFRSIFYIVYYMSWNSVLFISLIVIIILLNNGWAREKRFFEEKKNKKIFFIKEKFLFNLGNPTNLEDTVRNLREENAKLLQLLRTRKYFHFCK